MNEASIYIERGLSKTGIRKRIYFLIKRIVDILLSFLAIVILSPFFLLISICIRIDSKGLIVDQFSSLTQ